MPKLLGTYTPAELQHQSEIMKRYWREQMTPERREAHRQAVLAGLRRRAERGRKIPAECKL
jgi:nitrate/nitrite-specific signal transduction histidine kinase